jgi:glutamate synthase (NADPH/NADH) small chain
MRDGVREERPHRRPAALRHPDFKLDKRLIDWRMAQMKAEGVKFVTGTMVTGAALPKGIVNDAKKTVSAGSLQKDFDAVVLAGGAENPRDLPVPGRELKGVHFALEFLIPQNKEVAGDRQEPDQRRGKHVLVIGGGDTGSDCVGTSNRHGAASITQIELLPRPPEQENGELTWPYWPLKMRTSSSHDEGCSRDWAIGTKEFIGEKGVLKAVKAVRLEWKDGRMSEIAGSEFEIPADSSSSPWVSSARWAACSMPSASTRTIAAMPSADTEGGPVLCHQVPRACSPPATCAAASRWWSGPSAKGRQCARTVDQFLMGSTTLPR